MSKILNRKHVLLFSINQNLKATENDKITLYLFKDAGPHHPVLDVVYHLEDDEGEGLEVAVLDEVGAVGVEVGEDRLGQGMSLQPCCLVTFLETDQYHQYIVTSH